MKSAFVPTAEPIGGVYAGQPNTPGLPAGCAGQPNTPAPPNRGAGYDVQPNPPAWGRAQGAYTVQPNPLATPARRDLPPPSAATLELQGLKVNFLSTSSKILRQTKGRE